MIPHETEQKTIQSIDRAFRIIEYIQANDEVTLSELSSVFEISKSAIHYHLNTLMKHGYVIKEGKYYYIGLRFLDPAIHAKNRKRECQIVHPKVEYLAEETGERAQFITEENGLGIHVHSEIGENGIQSESRVGKTVYLHATSAGKAILASLPRERVEEIVSTYGTPALTENTIDSHDELFGALDEIRDRGYAFNRAERKDGMMAIGAPVKYPDGQVLGAVSVTGPLRRMEEKHEDDLPNLLLDITEEIRLRLEYPQH